MQTLNKEYSGLSEVFLLKVDNRMRAQNKLVGHWVNKAPFAMFTWMNAQ